MRAASEIKATILSGELARLSGVSTDTLRYYERKRVLPRPFRSQSGYRCYPASSVDRVKLIRAAIGIGIRLDELALILQERDRGGAPCMQVFSLARQRLAELEDRIQQLNSCRDEMQKIVTTWEQILSTAKPQSRVNLLESIADHPSGLDREATYIRNLHPLKKRKGKS
jgi:MerR family copper efflux transcriptional regulator